MELGIQGKRAAVAAASAGLGFESARALANEGVQVVICGRDRSRIDAAAARIGHDTVGLVADVGTPDGARAFVAAATEAMGGLDILVTNAGGPPAGTFESTPFDAYPTAIDLNLLSIVAMCQSAVPAMQAQGWGRVVAITSVSVRQPIANLILSNTARAGATGFLKTLAREVFADGVTVNSAQPGLHATDRVAQLYGDSADPSSIGDPADFGAIVAFLCSQQAKFTTGVGLHIDGGTYQGLL
ncbi:MAG TPA: SDR family oxidoreductase [Ilumatobacter sp.]|nr:SDR family oxidoreductase [Ilumatobacter sp.]